VGKNFFSIAFGDPLTVNGLVAGDKENGFATVVVCNG
jgi:hypothetical protein